MPCSLDGLGKHALVLCAGPGGGSGQDLPAVGYKTAQKRHVLVIDDGDIINGKVADFPSASAKPS